MNLSLVEQNIPLGAPTLADLKNQCPWTYGEIFESNTYGFHTSDVAGKAVLDIGAHRGFFSVLAAGSGAKAVIAVESNKNTFSSLLKNVILYDNIYPLHMAAYDEKEQSLRAFGEIEGTAKVTTDGKPNVQARSLQQLASLLPGPGQDDVLKMDCEGSEYDILISASMATIRRFKIIFMEVHGQGTDARSTKFIKDYLYFMGYEIAWTFPVYWKTFDASGKIISQEPLKDIEVLKFHRVR